VRVARGGFPQVEKTPLEGDRGEAVIQRRLEFHELMRQRFGEVIERATGRRVMNTSHIMSGCVTRKCNGDAQVQRARVTSRPSISPV